jgi:predicted N-acyltransferase
LSTYSVTKFTPEQSKEWDDFILRSENGTIFHERTFINYHPLHRFTDHSLIFKNKGNIIGLLPAHEISGDKSNSLVSHQGISFGGIAYKNLQLKTALALVESLLDYCRKNSFSRIIITLPPVNYSTLLNQNMEFALLTKCFKINNLDLTSVIQLDALGDNIIDKYDNKARTNIRKAENEGVQISFNNDINAFYNILEKNFNERLTIKATHSLDDLKYLTKKYPDRVLIYAAHLNKKMIAGSLLFVCNKNTVLTFYLVMDPEFQILRPLNLLIYELTKWSIKSGFKFIDFGTVTKNNKINHGLNTFKENFAGHGVFRKTLEIFLE